MKLTRVALVAGLLVVPAFLTGCKDAAAQRSSVDQNVANAKQLVGDLKTMFASGQTKVGQAGAEGATVGADEDMRIGLVALLITDKIPHMVNRRVADNAKRQQVLAKTKEAGKIFDEMVPKYLDAVKSKKPEDAKALVPMMERLEKLLDEMGNLIG